MTADIRIEDPHPTIRNALDPLREKYGVTWEQLLFVLVATKPDDDVFKAASFADHPDDVLDQLADLAGGGSRDSPADSGGGPLDELSKYGGG